MIDHATNEPPYPYLYRVLRRNENYKRDGIQAKNPNAKMSVYNHVNKGSYYDSQYISTSGSLRAAQQFASRSKRYKNGETVKIIRINTQGLDDSLTFINLNDTSTRYHYFPERDFAYNCANKFEEVLVIGRIPAECIDDIKEMKKP